MADHNAWEALLAKLLEPDTRVINNATAELNELLKNPESTVRIFERLVNSANIGVRHQAALLVRRRLFSVWGDLPAQVQSELQKSLVVIIENAETPRPIRSASCDIINIIARILVPQNAWENYFPWVISLLQKDERFVYLQEMGFYLLQHVMESDMQTRLITPHFENVKDLLIKGLSGPSVDIRIRAMSACNSFVECLSMEKEVGLFLTIIPPLLCAIKLGIDDHDERVASGFEILTYSVENHIAQIKQILPDMLVFMLGVGADVEIPISIRQKALMFLEFVVSDKPKTFVNANLVEPTISVSFQVMTEPEDDVSGEDTGSKYGIQLIDTMCTVLPASMVWPLCISKIEICFKHSDPEYRKAAINAIAVLSEGCTEQTEEMFDDLMPCVLAGFNQEPVVRQAACIAISEFAKNLPYMIVPYGEQLVPILIAGIQDPNDLVRVKSCYAISECSTSLKSYLMPHIEPLMKRLVDMLADTNVEVQDLAVGALSAIVDMAGDKIAPYFGAIIEVMKKWMAATDKSQLSVRARAIECVASLAGAQHDLFLGHFEECMLLVLSGLQINDPELREFIYGYCEHMTRLFTEQMIPYVEGLIPFVFATLESFEGFAAFGADRDAFTVDDEVGDSQIDLQKLGRMVDEKDAAISLLGWMAFNFGGSFEPFVAKSHELLVRMTQFLFSPTTASNATLALVQLCSCVQVIVDPQFGWIRGQFTGLHPAVAKMISECLDPMITNLSFTEDIIVSNSIEAICNLAMAFGPAAIPQDNLTEIVDSLLSLLKREAPCQLVRESFDEDESELRLFSVVMDSVSQLIRVYGDVFLQVTENVLMCLPPYLAPEAATDYRNISIASIAEFAQELKEQFQPYCATFLPIAINALTHGKDPSLKHNSAYCAGLLVCYGADSVYPFFESLSTCLGNGLSLDPQKYDTALDNVCGAIARMINANPSLVPIDAIFPAMLNMMPLRMDFEPATPIHQAIFNLLQANHPVIAQTKNQLGKLFVVELLTSDLKDELKNQLRAYVKSIYKSDKAQIDQLLETLVAQECATSETIIQFHAALNE